MAKLDRSVPMPPSPKRVKHIISKRRRKVFLKVLSRCGMSGKSAQAAGFANSVQLHKERNLDPDFAKAWDEALEAAADVIEDEVLRRGVDGVLEPVFYKGEVTGHKLVYSDRLAELALKGAKPNKYRENIRVDGEINHNVGVAVIPAIAPQKDWEKASLEVHKDQDKNRITVDSTARDVTPDNGEALSR